MVKLTRRLQLTIINISDRDWIYCQLVVLVLKVFISAVKLNSIKVTIFRVTLIYFGHLYFALFYVYPFDTLEKFVLFDAYDAETFLAVRHNETSD